MIPKEKLPQRDFTIDEVEASGYERKEVINTCKRLESEGEGKFITGRKGHASRWQWSAPQTTTTTSSTPAPETNKSFSALMAKLKGGIAVPAIQEEKSSPIEEDFDNAVEVVKSERVQRTKGERDPFLVVRDQREGLTEERVQQSLTVAAVLSTVASLTGFKSNGPISWDDLTQFLDNQHQELVKLREGATWEEPPGIEHVPVEWLTNILLPNGILQMGDGFWDGDQRKLIAKELLLFRRGK